MTETKYQQAQRIAEQGQLTEALALLEEHLHEHPDDPEALNDIAAVLHCLNRSHEAIGYLYRARRQRPDDPKIIWNLAEVLIAESLVDEARLLFNSLEKAGILSFDLLNRTARLLLDQGRAQEGLELLQWSQRLCPEQTRLDTIIESVRMHIHRPKTTIESVLTESNKTAAEPIGVAHL